MNIKYGCRFKNMSRWQHIKAILLLPFMVTVVIPFILCLISYRLGVPWMFIYRSNFLSLVFGIILMIFGYVAVYKTNQAFASIGKGTLAPWKPTQHIVTSGLYSYVRNPMILGVLLVLFGEVIIFGSTLLLLWFLIFGVVNHIWFVYWEEPHLERKFTDKYRQYKANVPRWIPRRHPWTPGRTTDE